MVFGAQGSSLEDRNPHDAEVFGSDCCGPEQRGQALGRLERVTLHFYRDGRVCARQGNDIFGGHAGDPGKSTNFAQQFVIKIDADGSIHAGGGIRENSHSKDVFGLETRICLHEPPEALHQESGTEYEGKSQCDFGDDEHIAKTKT